MIVLFLCGVVEGFDLRGRRVGRLLGLMRPYVRLSPNL